MNTKPNKVPEISYAFHSLRQELECLCIELEDEITRSSYDRVCEIQRKGQDILRAWVKNNVNCYDGRHLITGKFGSEAQFGFYFKNFSFRIDPLRENQDSYRWYASFGDDTEDTFIVLASLGFNS